LRFGALEDGALEFAKKPAAAAAEREHALAK
jgi:hypothetical protein